jgi:hypothetical protein
VRYRSNEENGIKNRYAATMNERTGSRTDMSQQRAKVDQQQTCPIKNNIGSTTEMPQQ